MSVGRDKRSSSDVTNQNSRIVVTHFMRLWTKVKRVLPMFNTVSYLGGGWGTSDVLTYLMTVSGVENSYLLFVVVKVGFCFPT